MLSLHNIENALLNLSFDYSVIRDAVKSVDAYNNNPQVCVTVGDVTLRKVDVGCWLTVERLSDCGRWQYVDVVIKDSGAYGITGVNTVYQKQAQTGNVIQFPNIRSL
jgi:hypothetical protein